MVDGNSSSLGRFFYKAGPDKGGDPAEKSPPEEQVQDQDGAMLAFVLAQPGGQKVEKHGHYEQDHAKEELRGVADVKHRDLAQQIVKDSEAGKNTSDPEGAADEGAVLPGLSRRGEQGCGLLAVRTFNGQAGAGLFHLEFEVSGAVLAGGVGEHGRESIQYSVFSIQSVSTSGQSDGRNLFTTENVCRLWVSLMWFLYRREGVLRVYAA